jgi:calcineurin-like phosphoesterase family protein
MAIIATGAMPGCHQARTFSPQALAGTPRDIVPGNIKYTLLLIGDAGEMTGGKALMNVVQTTANKDSAKTTVLFLGDNVYPKGVPDPSKDRAKFDSAAKILDAQMDAVGNAQGVFVPGNHDWENRLPARRQFKSGIPAMQRESTYIANRHNPKIFLAPAPGCGGPYEIRTDGFRILALDTQWWLATIRTKNAPPSSDTTQACRARSDSAMTRSLGAAASSESALPLVVVGHHPLATSGEHRTKTWWKRVAVLFTGNSSQDLTDAANKKFRESVAMALAVTRPLLYASGHDHDIELRAGTVASYYLVTGAGSPAKVGTAFVARDPETLLTANGPGFTRVDAMRDGSVALRVIVMNGNEAQVKHCRWLAPIAYANQPCALKQ